MSIMNNGQLIAALKTHGINNELEVEDETDVNVFFLDEGVEYDPNEMVPAKVSYVKYDPTLKSIVIICVDA